MTRVLLLALLPFAGNFAGAALAETLSPSDAWRNRALHAAVGIVFAVVAMASGCANTIRGVGADAANTVDATQSAGRNVAGAAE